MKKKKKQPYTAQTEPLTPKEAYQKKLKKALLWYGLFALWLIPVYTVKLATKADLLEYSISFVGNSLGHRQSLILWTVMSGVFFASFVGYLLVLTRNTASSAKKLIYVASGMLILSNLIPFLPEQFPKLAQYHSFFAMASSLMLAVTLFVFVWALRKFDRRVFKKSMRLLLLVVSISGALMMAFGVNSLLEVVAIWSVCLFMFIELVWLLRADGFDGVQVLREVDAHKAVEEAKKLQRRAQKAQDDADELHAMAKKARQEARKLCHDAGLKFSALERDGRDKAQP